MFITYTPTDDEPEQKMFFQLAKLYYVEAEKIESITPWTFQEFRGELLKGSARARRVMLWILLKRQHPTLKLEDINPTVDGIKVEMDKEEYREAIADISKSSKGTEEERAEYVRRLEAELEDAPESERPKARSNDAGTD